ncbi:hypothetical protein Efla_005808 [Eimeria flavescens]
MPLRDGLPALIPFYVKKSLAHCVKLISSCFYGKKTSEMSIAVQAQIRRNAEEVRAFLSDLREWEQSFEDDNGGKKKGPVLSNKEESQQVHQQSRNEEHENHRATHASGKPPSCAERITDQPPEPGQPALETPTAASSKDRKKYARDLNSLPDYYKAWDAYDPDAEEPADVQPSLKTQTEKQAQTKASSTVARGARRGQKGEKVQQGARMRVCTSATPLSLNLNGQNSSPEQQYIFGDLVATKNKGNAAFAAGHYKTAVECYTEALQQAKTVKDQSVSAVADFESQMYGNRAAAYYRLKKHDRCIEDCTEALQKNSQNLKALHRRGLAWASKGDGEKAVQDLREALESLEQKEKRQQDQQLTPHREFPSLHSSKDPQAAHVCSSTSMTDGLSTSAFAAREWSSLKEKILHDLTRVRNELEDKKRREKERRKAALLQPLDGVNSRFPKDTLRALEVRVFQQPDIRRLNTQQTEVQKMQQDRIKTAGGIITTEEMKHELQGTQEQQLKLNADEATHIFKKNGVSPASARLRDASPQQKHKEEIHVTPLRAQDDFPQDGSSNKLKPHVDDSWASASPSVGQQISSEQERRAAADACSKHAKHTSTSSSSGTPPPVCIQTLEPPVPLDNGDPIPHSFLAFEVQWRSAGRKKSSANCRCGGSRAALLLRLGSFGALQGAVGSCIDPGTYFECLQVLDQAGTVLIEQQYGGASTDTLAGNTSKAVSQEAASAEASVKEANTMDEASHKAQDASKCPTCNSSAFTAAAWLKALQQLLQGPRTTVAIQLAGRPCRRLLESLQRKACALSTEEQAAGAAKRCSELLMSR